MRPRLPVFFPPRARANLFLALSFALCAALMFAMRTSATFDERWPIGGTLVEDDITANTVWSEGDSPYLLTQEISVRQGVMLTIGPNVTVMFKPTARLTVRGNLEARGTEASPILFTGQNPSPGSWRGLNIFGNGIGFEATATLDHVIIEHGGITFTGANLYVNGSVVTVTNSILRDGGMHGIDTNAGGIAHVSDTHIENHPGYAMRMVDASVDPVLRRLTATGNGVNGVGLGGTNITRDHTWEAAGIPYVVEGGISVQQTALLAIEAGTEVRFKENTRLQIRGVLAGAGTVSQPIRFTGMTERPGAWRGLEIYRSGVVLLHHCDIGYGGAVEPLLEVGSNNVTIENCRLHHSAQAAVTTVGGALTIGSNRIEDNAFGIQNDNRDLMPVVDARFNWWGHASGPFHPTLNPDGQGDEVSDGVLFEPWLSSPDDTETNPGLRVRMASPHRVVPGSIEAYAISYANSTDQPVQDAVLVVSLPSYADYLDDNGGGIHWPQARQLFWRLGTLEPGEAGIVSFRVRFFSGLPANQGLQDFAQAHLAGSNAGVSEFDVEPYLTYTPTVIETETELTEAQATAERQAHPDLEAMFQQLRNEGYVYGSASRYTYNQGNPMTLIVMLDTEQGSVALVKHQGTATLTTEVTEEYLFLRDMRAGGGGIRVNLQTEVYELYGSWSDTGAFQRFLPEASSFGECMKNCVVKLIPKQGVKTITKSISSILKVGKCVAAIAGDDTLALTSCTSIIKSIPGVGEGIDLGKCNSDCQNNPKSHVCSADLQVCDSYLGDWLGIDAIATYKCDVESGRYRAPESVPCAISEKCKEGPNGPTCTTCKDEGAGGDLFAAFAVPYVGAAFVPPPTALPSAAPTWTGENVLRLIEQPWNFNVPVATQADEVADLAMDEAETMIVPVAPAAASSSPCCDVVAAKDPNAKYGPMGDVVPGQLITYRITYENVGEGEAFDVFIMDPLSEHFDDATLVLNDGGRFITPTRTLMWEVGDLAPRGEPGSSGEVTFSVQLKAGLPSGTVILNQAVVHFPSVPEVTPTDPVVSVIQPLAAFSQEVETEAGDPLGVTLAGRDVSNVPLTYTLVEGPIAGEVSGTPPNLTYTSDSNFVGVDRLRFTVSNGTSTSRPGDVEIFVSPSPDDATPPAVVETNPPSDATITDFGAAPVFTDATGPLYAPPIRIQFSEPMAVSTLAAAIQVTRNGQAVPFALSAEGIVTEAILHLRQPLQDSAQYSVTLSGNATDLMGNPLTPYTFSFRVGEDAGGQLYLPLIQRPQ